MRKRVIWWSLTIIWCIIIFYQSGKSAVVSASESGAVVQFFNYLLGTLFGQNMIEVSDILVRKSAHYIEYFILGFLLSMSLYDRVRLFNTFALAVTISALYAVTDEIHQYFIPGRAMRIYDVAIDTFGALSAVVVLYLNRRRSA